VELEHFNDVGIGEAALTPFGGSVGQDVGFGHFFDGQDEVRRGRTPLRFGQQPCAT